MGDATLGSPIPLQAHIISSLDSFHKPVYVKNLSFAAYPLTSWSPLVLQSDSLSRAPPHPPSEDQRTGFSIGIGPVLWSQDYHMYNEPTNLYIRNLIPIGI
jgi:hypothetical protein